MHTIRVILAGEIREIRAKKEQLLSEALQAAGIAAPTPCGGSGKCGKCAVRAAGDLLPPPDEDGMCRACQTRVTGDAILWMEEAKPLQGIEGMGKLPAFESDPLPGRYGIAVDIGTTTLAAGLVSLEDGRILATLGAENPQRVVAHDVIGRIQASMEGKGDFERTLIESEIGRLCRGLCECAGIDEGEVSHRVYTGNTAMLYLLTGRDPSSLAAAPFHADCLFDLDRDGCYLPPCFGAYVGADIACALLAADLRRRHRTALLIDIGTNGEICLLHEEKLLCCATAAGPAFEGVGISCGVSSIPGAIERVEKAGEGLRVKTIGGAEPAGICGSGLIDAVAALLDTGALDETGYLEEEEAVIAPGICLTRKDIRMVQLAKGSICAGIQSLMAEANITEADVDAVYIAGGFGRHIHIASALRIGLIPEFAPEKVRAIGNAALAGAVMLMMKQGAKQEMRDLVKRAQCINLAELPRFQMLYPEAMLFPEE